MILQTLDYSVANLLHSKDAVAICQAEGERLKDLILLMRDAGWGVVVIESVAGDHYVFAAASPVRQGNLLGDVRKWNRDQGYQFFLKRSDKRISTPKPNVFVLPDGREVEIRRTYTIASGFTHWALPDREPIPAGYVRF
jgi:hypothetical protein